MSQPVCERCGRTLIFWDSRKGAFCPEYKNKKEDTNNGTRKTEGTAWGCHLPPFELRTRLVFRQRACL